MEHFTLRFPRSRTLAALGRNGLLRWQDRVEAVAALLAVVAAVLGIPVAAAIGTTSYEGLVIANEEYSTALRQLSASVAGPAEPRGAQYGAVDFRVPLRWTVDGAAQRGYADLDRPAHVGDVLTIWVDGSGRMSRGPIPESRAAAEATAIAVASWVGIACAAGTFTWLVRRALDHDRDDMWDRELAGLIDDGSRH